MPSTRWINLQCVFSLSLPLGGLDCFVNFASFVSLSFCSMWVCCVCGKWEGARERRDALKEEAHEPREVVSEGFQKASTGNITMKPRDRAGPSMNAPCAHQRRSTPANAKTILERLNDWKRNVGHAMLRAINNAIDFPAVPPNHGRGQQPFMQKKSTNPRLTSHGLHNDLRDITHGRQVRQT